jgi:hypothetical protein
MVLSLRLPRRPCAHVLALFILLSAGVPLHAAISTVFTCPSSGIGGNHDAVFNGFFVQNLNAVNLHSVTIYYTTDTDGVYHLTLTATRGSYAGPQVGTTQAQNVSLSSTSETPVTWNLGDAPFTPGNAVYFTHTYTGTGGVSFNLQPTICAGDEETNGTSSTLNGFSVAVTITENTSPPPPPSCVANSTTLCIDDAPGDKRFKITSTFSTTQGGGISGNGQAIPLASLGVTQGGVFWFFGSTNPEMLIKVINACSFNNHFWVFFAATTNVGFHVTVTDTKNGHMVTYVNPDGTAALPVQDTSALTGCP